jgi:uncharacterized protein with HEPN domain
MNNRSSAENVTRDNQLLIAMVEHIDNAISDMSSFADSAELSQNRVVQNSVAMELIQIAELGRKVSDGMLLRHSDVPWAEIRGMRNRLVHEYGEVEWDIVFSTVRHDLPEFRSKLEQLTVKPQLPDEPDSSIFSEAPRIDPR